MRHDAQVINRIKEVQSFPSLLKFLRDDLDWPITSNDVEDLTFDYSPDELGFDKKMAVKVRSIKQLRPLVKDQPWGIFYIDFEPKRLPVGALRRLLRSLVVKKRGGGDGSQATWNLDDLLFISFHGEESRRTVAFAHFHEREKKQPQLRTFYWDQGETEFACVLESLGKLNWPQYAGSTEMAHVWRQYWGAAFRVGHGEVIRDSKALSKKLAQVALKIRQHVFDLLDAEDADKGPLHRLFASFKKALLHDLDEQRFADVLAQTFTYGLLAAKAEVGTKTPLEPGHLAEQIPATNPLLRELFEEFQHLTGVGLDKLDEDLGDLGVDELVDLLNTVDVDEALKNFGRTTMSGQEDPVVHFYEEFLKDYDKEQKVERGVFYTPKPVVSFIVRSVHEILQKEFGLEDGLASTASWDDMVAKHEGLAKPEGIRGDEPFVQILDPAVGTGTFLEACIQLIYDTMAAKWSREGKDVKAEWNRYVPEHLLPRLHGFELMMAPYVVCHMKLGLRLKELGYDFQSGERLRIFLTNSLEPPVQKQETLIGLMDAVAHEAHQANAVKKEVVFAVAIGNPPYSGRSTNKGQFITELLSRYKAGVPELAKAGMAKWLSDDYVKFILATQNWLEKAPLRCLGFITNHGYLENPTFRGMRRELSQSFPTCTYIDLKGSTKKRGASDVRDQNVFDIQQGVAIALLRRSPSGKAGTWFYEITGTRDSKYEFLTSTNLGTLPAQEICPSAPAFLFKIREEGRVAEYERGISVSEVFALAGDPAPGFVTTHDDFAISFSSGEAIEKATWLALSESEEVARGRFRLCKQSQWSYRDAKQWLANRDLQPYVQEFLARPFDRRFTLWTPYVAVHRRERTFKHFIDHDNLGLVCTKGCEVESGWEHIFVTTMPVQHHTLSTKEVNYCFPLFLFDSASAFGGQESRHSIPDKILRACCSAAGREVSALNVFSYVYSLVWAPSYRSRFRDLLRAGFPRIFLPSAAGMWNQLSDAGQRLIQLHTVNSNGNSVTVVGGNRRVEMYRRRGSDIDINATTSISGVSDGVWNFTMGGAQVVQKWLKDRKGRVLSPDDLTSMGSMIHSIGETIRIMSEIDEVIEAHGGWPSAFQGGGDG